MTENENPEAHKSSNSRLYRILSWLVTILVPVVLVLTSVRLVMTPALLHFEYGQPGFPPDPYGFTKQDRLYWAGLSLDYLLNTEDISFLEQLEFADGTPIYNARELRHMVDVKNTVSGALIVLYISWSIIIILGFWSWKGGWWQIFKQGASRGGWLTLLFIGSILLFVLLSFRVLFVAFHNVFFQPGTWQFLWSDTLIRLFPQKFWQDVFLIVGGLTFIGGLLFAIGFRIGRGRK